MALPPKFAGQAFTTAEPKTQHTLELYLDYVCPFSAKMFHTLYTSILPTIRTKHPNVKLLFRNQIQPWHPSSTLTHEAGIAVLRLYPGTFWDFSAKLFERQQDFFDVNVVHEARNETYARLAEIVEEAVVSSSSTSAEDKDGVERKVMDLLRVGDKPGEDGGLNTGNRVTNDVKFMVKAARMQGVHVTPTVVFDGVVEPGISSGMSGEEWEAWLRQNVD